jgi:hypothetical protein
MEAGFDEQQNINILHPAFDVSAPFSSFSGLRL